jgi:serine/threonine protein kinase
MSGDQWDKVSEKAKDFVRKCLTKDMQRRPKIEQLVRSCEWAREENKAQ